MAASVEEERRNLDAILATIEDVEASLARRGARASGATMMIWAAAVAGIFAFYHQVQVEPDALVALLGPVVVQWVWVAPVAVAYVLTAALGAAAGRMGSSDAAHGIRTLMIALVPALALQVLALVKGVGVEQMPAMWVAFLGVKFLTDPSSKATGALPTVCRGAAALSFALALVMLLPAMAHLTYIVASVWYAAVLGGLGALIYHRGGRHP